MKTTLPHGNTRPPALHIGGTIKALRLERGLSTSEVAAHFGVTDMAVNQMENRENPRLHTIEKMAQFFNLSVSAFLAIHEVRMRGTRGN